jgi:hypothetical protein
MNTNVELRCACGAVEGVVLDASPKTLNRAVCYCDDCQAFARFLGRDDIMDAQGASDIIQIPPSQLRFTKGTDKLRSMFLSPKGVLRWYTDCCKTPAGNMLNSPRCPFTGIPKRMFVLDGSVLDAAVGKPLGTLHGRFAIGGCPPGAEEKASLGVILRCTGWLLGNAIRGKHKPSPYWTDAGKLVSEPQVLTAEERMPFYRNP